MVFKIPFLNILLDDLNCTVGKQKKLSLIYGLWLVVAFAGTLFGVAFGLSQYGWIGGVLGIPFGLGAGFLAGGMCIVIVIMLEVFRFRILLRQGWFVSDEYKKKRLDKALKDNRTETPENEKL